MIVVKEIVSRLLEEEERSWNGGLSKTLMLKKNRMKKVMVVRSWNGGLSKTLMLKKNRMKKVMVVVR
nr:hypothetical protein [Tanacetum cinerariifolium]